jgi:hypothetical protein
MSFLTKIRAAFIAGALSGVCFVANGTPTFVSQDNDLLHFTGGDDAEAEAFALQKCKEISDYFVRVKLEKEWFVIWTGKNRQYRCAFWPQGFKRPTSLEQRVMQSRKFSKSPTDVLKGIKSWGDASGGRLLSDTMINLALQIGSSMPVEAVVNLPIKNTKYSLLVKLEVDGKSLKASETVVRMRTYVGLLSPQYELFNTKIYRDVFNQLADELFVSAIEIEPVEQK